MSTLAGNKRTQAAQRTRQSLIDTGLALSEQLGLDHLSVNAVVEGAGVSKGTFFHHFRDRVSYLLALHRGFHDAVYDEVVRATAGMPPGGPRLDAAANTYLDECLRHRGVKALLLEARGLLPLADEVLRRNRLNVDAVASDFEALGVDHPRETARLWVAATAESALLELERGQRDPATRAALAGFTAR